jgi:hypothetical protein
MIEVMLAVFSAISAFLGVLTLASSDVDGPWWKKTTSIAKLLALNVLIVLVLGVVKIYIDTDQNNKKEAQLSNLEKSLESSLLKQQELKNQLGNTQDKLQKAIAQANEKELQYYKSKDEQLKNNWASAFKAEREINIHILNFLSYELNNNNKLGFLYKPNYMKINYLGSLIKAPQTGNKKQLQMMTLLYEELNEINVKIKAGSSAVQLGNYDKMMSGLSRFFGVEDNAKNALSLYETISAQL